MGILQFMKWMLKRQGSKLVTRDAETQEIKKTSDGRLMAAEVKPKAKKETWRSALSKLTDNGKLLDDVLVNLALGNAYTARLPDGRESAPIVPSPEVRRAAAIDILHMVRGKPVSQTEVMDAVMADEELDRYRAISDEELLAAVKGDPYLERVDKKRLKADSDDE